MQKQMNLPGVVHHAADDEIDGELRCRLQSLVLRFQEAASFVRAPIDRTVAEQGRGRAHRHRHIAASAHAQELQRHARSHQHIAVDAGHARKLDLGRVEQERQCD